MNRCLVAAYALYSLAACVSVLAIALGCTGTGVYLLTALFSVWRMGVIEGVEKRDATK